MLIYFIILIFIKFCLLIPSCKEGEKNCIFCNPITKLCVECDKDIYSPDENGGCKLKSQCKLGHNSCLQCAPNENICVNCDLGFYPDKIGGCSYTVHCSISYKGTCLKCDDDYVLIGKEVTYCKSINTEDLKNCKEVNTVNGLCKNCTEGYYLNSLDKKCSKTENCSESLYGICNKCSNGYYLDKREEKCKIQNGTFNHCKLSINGEICDECDNDYYFDEEKKCIGINFCAIGNSEYNCKKCFDGYYLSEFKDSCTKTPNCYEGNKKIGVCMKCNGGFYIDFKDGKCKSNKEHDEFSFCNTADNGVCNSCIYGFTLGKDSKCSSTKYCEESEYGVCVQCIEKYYLGLDKKCSNIENCIYTNDFEECEECKDNYYYNRGKWRCEISSGIFTGCKNGFDRCSSCKNNYYLNQTDLLCYSNEEEGPFYKCAMTDFNAIYCADCIEGYNLGEKDHKCTLLEGCRLVNEENKCVECSQDYCLDSKNGVCKRNYMVISEEEKIYFRCQRTNEEGTGCQICSYGYNLTEVGLCADIEHCIEKNEEGVCQRCQNDENHHYCLNHDFGCIESPYDDCLECGNILDFDKCTKCKEGYELGNFDLCYEIENNK